MAPITGYGDPAAVNSDHHTKKKVGIRPANRNAVNKKPNTFMTDR